MSLLIATHAPLIVTGALTKNSDIVSVYSIDKGAPRKISISEVAGKPKSIEEILWKAFEVITPANHYVSERIVNEISRFERGEIKKQDVLNLINDMETESFDDRQFAFFQSVKHLLDKVQNYLTGIDEDD